jgi:translation initiation factor 4E
MADQEAAAADPESTEFTAASTPDLPPMRPVPHLPLHCQWTLWYDNPRLAPKADDVASPSTDTWKESLKTCGSFRTVEEFWRIYNNIRPPSTLSLNSNYSLFREGITPSWEDAANINGGKFVFTLDKKESKRGGKLDEYWFFTVLAVIGETMDASGDQITGAVVSVRKSEDRIALWLKSSGGGETSHWHDRTVCVRIAERWKKALKLSTENKQYVRFSTHKDAAATGRSFRNEVQFEV